MIEAPLHSEGRAPASPSAAPQVSGDVRAWQNAARVAAIFWALVAAAMLISHLEIRNDEPLHSPLLRSYKEKLRLNPSDEGLKKEIRDLDLRLRQKYFQHLSRMRTGVFLLLGGVAVMAYASGRATSLRRQPPMPAPNPDATEHALRLGTLSRWAVAAAGAATAVFLLSTTFGPRSALPARSPVVAESLEPAPGSIPSAAPDFAGVDELRRNWPRFRGFDGAGVAFSTNLPSAWNTASGLNVLWKVPTPAEGFNSPIVWERRIFMSGGDAGKREVFCLDAGTGRLLWRQDVSAPLKPGEAAEIPDSTGWAAPTMATDGRRVYVIFANGDVAALTLEGKIVWSKSFGPLKNPYGHATSLATWRDRLMVQLDQGEAEEGKSRLYAVDGATGRIAWQRPRKAGASWATPLVFEFNGQAQIVTLAVPFAISYAAADGAELWKADCLNGEVTPSPAFANGVVCIASPSEKLVAVRPDGRGDVTKTHVLWTHEDNVPDVTSPAANGQFVFTVTTAGVLCCVDATTGKKLWEHDFETDFHASPLLAGNRLFLFSQKGLGVIVEAGAAFKELARKELEDGFHASPAWAQDRIILRGLTNVWALGPNEPKPAANP